MKHEIFHIEDKGDPSVGIDGFYERVLVVWLDREHVLDDDEIEAVGDVLACDGTARTDEQFKADLITDAQADTKQHQEWMKDEIYKYAPESAEKLIERLNL